MKGDELFFDDEWRGSGLPPDGTVPLATWTSLPATNRCAQYVADMLLAVADIQWMLATDATDAAARLRWIEPVLHRTAVDADRFLQRLAC